MTEGKFRSQSSGPEESLLATLLVEKCADAFITTTLDGRILSWSPGATAMFGYDRDAALGRSLEELIVPVDGFDAARAARREACEGADVLREDIQRRQDGTFIHVDVAMRRVEHEGYEPFLLVTAKDITPLRRLHDQQAVELKFRGLLEAAPDAMVIVGPDGRIQLVNGQLERLFGYPREELFGRPVEILVPPRYRRNHPGHRADYFADPHPRPMGAGLALHGVRRDGSEFPAEISLAPMRMGDQILVTAAIRDVSERRALERRMQEANRLKSEFVANMSHELRTPLNAIIGFAELMHRGKVGPVSPEHQEYLGDILTSSKHLLQLINDVLDLAKVESGKMEFRPIEVDVSRLVGEVRDVLRGLAASKRLQVQTDIAPDIGKVLVDPSRVKQILYNYLSNAIKFTPEGGTITVRVSGYDEQNFRLEVEDTGIGIPEASFEKLFVEFHQLDSTASKRYQGTGLGLALTKRIAEAHGGKVSVVSVPGKGSTFSAILPRSFDDHAG